MIQSSIFQLLSSHKSEMFIYILDTINETNKNKIGVSMVYKLIYVGNTREKY